MHGSQRVSPVSIEPNSGPDEFSEPDPDSSDECLPTGTTGSSRASVPGRRREEGKRELTFISLIA